MIQKIYLSYIAGLMDGEGSFQIKRKLRSGRINYQLWVTCGMSNIPENFEVLKNIQKIIGGNICSIKPKENRIGAVHWTIVSQQALRFLKLIKPYIKIKNKQLNLLIEFQTKFVSRKGKKKDLVKFKKQEEMCIELRKLNFKNKLELQRLSERTSLWDDATV